MVKLTILDKENNLLVEGEVAQDRRLVLAIEDLGVDILHLCGSFARCTTCRVQFIEGEPDRMTVAEKEIIEKRLSMQDEEIKLPNIRTSCQILATHDMKFKVLKRLSATTMESAGDKPKEEITPDPVWIETNRS